MDGKKRGIPSSVGNLLLMLLGVAFAVSGVVIFTLVRDAGAFVPYGLYASVLAVVLGLLVAGFGIKNAGT